MRTLSPKKNNNLLRREKNKRAKLFANDSQTDDTAAPKGPTQEVPLYVHSQHWSAVKCGNNELS